MIGRDVNWMMTVLQARHGYHNAVVVFRLSYVCGLVIYAVCRSTGRWIAAA